MLSLIRDFDSNTEMPESIVGCVNVFRVFCRINSKTSTVKKRPGENERNRTWLPLLRTISMGSGRTCSSLRSSPIFTWQAWSKTSSTLVNLLFQRKAFSLRALIVFIINACLQFLFVRNLSFVFYQYCINAVAKNILK